MIKDTLVKISVLFSRRERKSFLLIFFVITLMAFMEVLGIASIMPFMSVVSKPDIIESNFYLNAVYTSLGFKDYNHFFIFAASAVLVLILTSNAFTIMTTWLILRFTHMRSHALSVRFLEHYLSQPYSFYLNRNTSELNKNLLSEVGVIVTGILIPGMMIVARSMTALLIMSMLLLVDPVLTLVVVAVLGTAYYGIYCFSRKKIVDIGNKRVGANHQRYKISGEAFGGIKDLKLLGRESYFIKAYSDVSENHARYQSLSQVISEAPKYLVEAIAFGGVLAIIIYLIAAKQGLANALPLMSLYVLAGYRLLPSLQHIYHHSTHIRYNMPALDLLYQDIKLYDSPVCFDKKTGFQNESLKLNEKIQLKNVSYAYPGKADLCIKELNLTIPARTTVGLVGPTGAGKTTLVDLFLGLLRPCHGKVCIDGVELTEKNLHLWQRNIGYVPQNIFLYDDSIRNNIAYAIDRQKIDQSSVERAARIANIHDFIMNELPDGYDTVVGERGIRLSGGQRQRIGIARALYHDPEFLILDEATSALDGVTENAVMEAIKTLSHKKTIIMIAHRLTTVQECDVIYLLENGMILSQGKYGDLIQDNQLFRAMAGTAV